MNMHRKTPETLWKSLLAVLCLTILLCGLPAGSAFADTLPAPQNLDTTTTSASSVSLAWESVDGASYYRFYLNGSYYGNVYGTSYTATGLSANTVYGFRVAAVDGNGMVGLGSTSIYVRTAKTQLTAPQDLQASSKTSDSVTLDWNSVSAASYYRVYLNGSFTGNAYTTTYTATGLSSDTVYGFRVAAVDDSGTVGLGSNSIYVRTAKTQLTAPQDLQAASTASASVALTWSAVAGASYYRVYLNGSFFANASSTSYTATGLTADTVYGFRVAAVSWTGTVGLGSTSLYVRTAQALPAP